MSLTCQREDGFYGPKLTCPPLPPQQYAHRNQDSPFVSPSILSPSLSLSSPTDRTRSTLWSNSTRWWYSFTRESWHSVFLDRHPHNESTIFNLHAAQFRVTQNGRRNETRAHSVSLPPFEFPRRIDRSDRIEPIDRSIRSDPIREISALRYRHEARQPSPLSRSRSPCLIAIRSIASRSIALQTSIVSRDRCRACFPPLSEYRPFPSYVFRRLPFT